MLRSAGIFFPKRVLTNVKPALLGVLPGQEHGSQQGSTTMRSLSSESKIVHFVPHSANRKKLRNVFMDYYKKNYTQTVPSRFFKDIIHAADENKDGIIEFQEIRHLLNRIGYSDRITDEEIKGCLAEFGAGDDATIATEHMLDMLLHPETDKAST